MGDSPAVVRASIRTVRPLAAGLAARNVDVEAAFREVGIEPEMLADPDARVAAQIVHEAWRVADDLTGDPDFGLRTAGGIRPGSFDVLDYVCRNCSTVGEGLRLYCRFTPLLHDSIRATIVEGLEAGQELVRLRHVLADDTILPRQYAEFIIASLIVIVRQASEYDVVPRRVYFLHHAPADLSTHRAFFRSPIEFDAESNGFEMGREDFDRPLVEAQPGLLRVLEQHAEHLLEELPRHSTFVDQVRAAIVAGLRGGSAKSRELSGRIGVSERTLRRKLEADGTSYKRLLAEIRTELAARYIEEEHLSIDEVALLLGFSERSAFFRAFRQWTGRSPAEFRQRLQSSRAST